MKEQLYVFRWGWPRFCSSWRDLSGGRKGQHCRVLARGGRNSALVEFGDGLQAVTSRNALRKVLPCPNT